MGNRNSKALRISLLQPPQDIPVPIDVIKRNAGAICTICSNQQADKPSGGKSVNYKGVLIRLVTEGQQCIEGVLTHCTSKAITSCNADILLRQADETIKITVDTEKLYSFYCPLTEIVFIRFEQALADQIRANKCDFIHVPTQDLERIADNANVFICDSTLQKNQVTIHCGALKEYYGLDICHNAGCNDSSTAGLPVFTETGQLIGIQKLPCLGSSSTSSSLAVSMATLVATHFNKIFSSPDLSACALVTNPVNISDEYESQLRHKGLEKHEVLKPKYAQCNFFISPSEPYITPIWFMPTRLGWYWTPTDPTASDIDSNWMPVDRLAVIGGFWNGQIPAKKNVVIIRWLSQQQKEKKLKHDK